MAEATLAVSFAPLDTGVERRRRRSRGGWPTRASAVPAQRRRCRTGARTSSSAAGRCPATSSRSATTQGRVLPERSIGRIFIRGPSVMAGYFSSRRRPRACSTRTAGSIPATSATRSTASSSSPAAAKDLIIVNGRNIWPQDLEWAVEELEGVRRGDVAAFAIEGPDDGERCGPAGAVPRHRRGGAQRPGRARCKAIVQRTAGVECKVMLIDPKGLPQTSSGKLSRSRAKTNYTVRRLRTAGTRPDPAPVPARRPRPPPAG